MILGKSMVSGRFSLSRQPLKSPRWRCATWRVATCLGDVLRLGLGQSLGLGLCAQLRLGLGTADAGGISADGHGMVGWFILFI